MPSTETPRHDSTSHTASEIAQQPALWSEVADLVARLRPQLRPDLLDHLSRPGGRLVLSGAGSSAFAGQILTPALRQSLRCRIDAVATTDIVGDPRGALGVAGNPVLVSMARSGDSPESIAAVRLVEDYSHGRARHLGITCNADGALYRELADQPRAATILLPERSNDVGFAMTSSLTSMVLAAHLLLADDPPFAAVATAADDAAHLVRDRQDDIDALAARGYRRVVYLGSGPLAGVAAEAALKMIELTAGRVAAFHDTPLGFRHGPKAIHDDSTLVVVFLSTDPYARAYDLDIIDELSSSCDPDDLLVLHPGPDLTPCRATTWTVLDADITDPVLAALDYLVFAQSLAARTSSRLGLDVDQPFPGGQVNRVVQGVTIHPFKHSRTLSHTTASAAHRKEKTP